MWVFLSSLVAAIPAAATSKPGLTAFAMAAAVYIATVWRVSRNRQILANLQKLRPQDRLPALELEMGGVRLEGGISPEQWVRSRIHRYYFFAFFITVVLAAFLASLLFVYRGGSADITVDLKQSGLSSSPARDALDLLVGPAYALDRPGAEDDRDRTVRYGYSRDGHRTTLTPELTYLDSQRRGEPVTGFSWWHDPFKWDFPSLSVKVVNNTRRDLVLSEIVFRVRTSQNDDRPVFAVAGPSYFGTVDISNEGWGGISAPSLRVSIKSPDICGKFDLSDATQIPLEAYVANDGSFLKQLERNTVDDLGNVNANISKLVSDDLIDRVKTCSDRIKAICARDGRCSFGDRELSGVRCIETRPRDKCVAVDPAPSDAFMSRYKNEAARYGETRNVDIFFERDCSKTPVCVHGRLDFVDRNGQSGRLNFSTISVLEMPDPGAPLPPSFSYDVFLQAGKSDYTQRLSISQQVKPGEGDNFSLKLATDRSATFDFDMEILAVDGSVAWTGSFNAALLVPRNAARRARQSATFRATKQ